MNLALKANPLQTFLLASQKPNVEILIRKPPFILKTADTPEELEAAYRLRARVFFEESGNPALSEVDIDEFDRDCDHIVIIDERSGTLVGTYRVRSTVHHSTFYSAGEFDLRPILNLPGEKMELGRAAVHPEFRSGSVISILWRGIASYALKSQSNHLFGCSSVFTTDHLEAARVHLFLKKSGAHSVNADTRPTEDYKIQNFSKFVDFLEPRFSDEDMKIAEAAIPTLFHAYLRMGAKVCGEPALDAEFNCIDFLTLLDLEKLNRMFRRFQY